MGDGGGKEAAQRGRKEGRKEKAKKRNHNNKDVNTSRNRSVGLANCLLVEAGKKRHGGGLLC